MPLYDYECEGCGKRLEEFRKASDVNLATRCECGDWFRRKFFHGHGGVRCDNHVTWIDDDLRGALQDSDLLSAGLEKPIETRTELRNHVKANNLIERG